MFSNDGKRSDIALDLCNISANLRVWNVRPETKNLDVVDVALGKLRRSVRCISIAMDDSHGFAGTT